MEITVDPPGTSVPRAAKELLNLLTGMAEKRDLTRDPDYHILKRCCHSNWLQRFERELGNPPKLQDVMVEDRTILQIAQHATANLMIGASMSFLIGGPGAAKTDNGSRYWLLLTVYHNVKYPNNEPFRAVIYQGTIRRGLEHWVLSQDRTRSHPTIYKPQIWRNNTTAQPCTDVS